MNFETILLITHLVVSGITVAIALSALIIGNRKLKIDVRLADLLAIVLCSIIPIVNLFVLVVCLGDLFKRVEWGRLNIVVFRFSQSTQRDK
jgi:hypothetical protein